MALLRRRYLERAAAEAAFSPPGATLDEAANLQAHRLS